MSKDQKTAIVVDTSDAQEVEELLQIAGIFYSTEAR